MKINNVVKIFETTEPNSEGFYHERTLEFVRRFGRKRIEGYRLGWRKKRKVQDPAVDMVMDYGFDSVWEFKQVIFDRAITLKPLAWHEGHAEGLFLAQQEGNI